MNDIILDARRIKAFEAFTELGEYTGKEAGWLDELWGMLISRDELMTEFMYYIDNHSLLDNVSVSGISLTDIFVNQMGKYNLINDTGKNSRECNKETMILNSFYSMGKLMEDPDKYIKGYFEDPGMDRL